MAAAFNKPASPPGPVSSPIPTTKTGFATPFASPQVIANPNWWFTAGAGPSSPTLLCISAQAETDGCNTTVQAAGWNLIKVDRPCETTDAAGGAEPTGLNGWAYRMLSNPSPRDVHGEHVRGCTTVLQTLAALGQISLANTYVSGTSRAGQLALHLAASFKLAGMALFAPMVIPWFLTEFSSSGLVQATVDQYNAINKAALLKYLPSYCVVSTTDARVGTQNVTDFAAAVGSSMTFQLDATDSGHDTSAYYVPAGNALIAMEAARH